MTLITFFDYLDQIAAEDENFCLAVRYMEPNGDTYDTCVSYNKDSDYYKWGNSTGPSDEAEIQIWCPISKMIDKYLIGSHLDPNSES